ISDLQKAVDTLLIIPNQNLFRVANEKTTFADAFAMADQVLYSGVACITDLMVKEGLINLDFADVRAVMREMGKAMMGTGEASGEKRAMRSAEAAISNPLIDDVSMKGARGLLVSITGGRDLTLYEVDEAATRIREEVDQDANIIVGATFDESLEGIIRVSVVATGIDLAVQPAASASDTRLAELTQKLRAVQTKPIERPVRIETAAAASAAPVVAPAEHAEQLAAAEAAPATIEDVTIRPLTLKPPVLSEVDEDHHVIAAQEQPAPAKTFIPPQAERPVSRAPRMPRIDELPLPAQNELRARREQQAEAPAEKPKLGLLQRLASVGLGRREEAAPAADSQAAVHAPRPVERAPQPAPRAPETRLPDPVAEYARRPAPQPRPAPQTAPQTAPHGLDLHGRPAAPPAAPTEDDHLEIPAFLRRQAK
ncbi:MAG: cell division protein FtsZ, partial [Variibacter sp.]|nr:cell division protein FtsZ [Variibacter sp.]